VEAVIRQVIDNVSTALLVSERPVDFAIMGDMVKVASREATVLALVVNELISNALKHGLSVEGGRVEVEATLEGEMVTIEVRDDGPTHPKPPPTASTNGSGLGLQIIETLASDDLGGSFQLLRNPEDDWMRACIRFPQRIGNLED
jgi:two-component sensor histidine kinase